MKEKYEEYIESLLNVARLTTKQNSVLISFDIVDDQCFSIVDFVQQDGTMDRLKDTNFLCNDEFYKEFLEKFVIAYYDNMVIAFNDSIDMNADGKYTYRMITEDNDMMSIDGITLEYANHLMNLIKSKKDNVSVSNSQESGNVSFLLCLLLVGAIGLSLLGMFLLVG